MTEILDLPEKDPAGRPDVPKVFQDAFKIKPIKPTTGLQEGLLGNVRLELEPKGFFSRARRALSKALYRIDTNKENKPPLGKAF